MSVASIYTRALLGMESPQVTVEVHTSNGLPSFSIVGLPEASVKESKERVRSALLSSGFKLPPKRITVNLAPADLPKTGGRYDLPIALGILIATEQLNVDGLAGFECFGELALTGELRSVQGTIPSIMAAHNYGRKVILPLSNKDEAQLVFQTDATLTNSIFLVKNLRDAFRVLLGEIEPLNQDKVSYQKDELEYALDIADVVGQSQAKRALEIAASGEHSMMMVGPPGSGKSMLASRLITLLPELSNHDAIEVAHIRSLSGQTVEASSFHQRPFIHPHHTASAASIVGGGTNPKPGALSLSHKGVLFLDELPEFNRNVLEALREPLETRQVNISRVNQHIQFPADSLLIAAMNPSPSGYFPDDEKGRCKDTPDQILRYQKKISGPLLDRIDLHIDVPAVDVNSLNKGSLNSDSETSQKVRERVSQVRHLQLSRQGRYNSQLASTDLHDICQLDSVGKRLLEKAVDDLGLSARGYHRVLKVARTIADMDSSKAVQVNHLAEALSYRSSSKAFL